MRIETVGAVRVRVPRVHPFELAAGTFTAADHVIVRVGLEDGTVGFGECAPMVQFSEESQTSVFSVITESLGPALVGLDALNVASVHARMDDAAKMNPMAKAGLDMALYDAVGKVLDVSVSVLLGGVQRDRIPLAQSVGASTDEEMMRQAQIAIDDGYKVIKLKGGRDLTTDLRRIESLRGSIPTDAAIRLDANAGYTNADRVLVAMVRAQECGLDELEQPVQRCDSLGMSRIAAALTIPVLSDESSFSVSDAANLLAHRAADAINVKVQKAGGLYKGVRMAALVNGSGAGLLVGAMQETGIGTAASLQLAAVVEGLDYASDCRTHLAMCSTLISNELCVQDGWAYVPEGAGLGVVVDEEEVARYSQGQWQTVSM